MALQSLASILLEQLLLKVGFPWRTNHYPSRKGKGTSRPALTHVTLQRVMHHPDHPPTDTHGSFSADCSWSSCRGSDLRFLKLILHQHTRITENKVKQGTDVLCNLLFRCVKVSSGPFSNAAAYPPTKRRGSYRHLSAIVVPPNKFPSASFARKAASCTSTLTMLRGRDNGEEELRRGNPWLLQDPQTAGLGRNQLLAGTFSTAGVNTTKTRCYLSDYKKVIWIQALYPPVKVL